mgnify:CR=1 FL=1
MDYDVGEEDAECIFCCGLFSEDHFGEKWIKCAKCFTWAHLDCDNVDKKNTYRFLLGWGKLYDVPNIGQCIRY